MGQRDPSLPPAYLRELEQLLDESLALTLPDAVLGAAAWRAFARGLEPREAAVLIGHEHSRRLGQRLLERDEMASDLVEFALASRIDECARLAGAMGEDLLDLLPDLPSFLRQPCFSDAFRDMVAHIATWHGIPEHRWSTPEMQADANRTAGL